MSALASGVQTIPEALAYWAERTPDAVALLSPDHAPITYAGVRDAVDRLAAQFRARGLGHQDAIALLVSDEPDLSIGLLAAMSVGIAVPLAWPSPTWEYREVLAHKMVRAIVTSAGASSLAVLLPEREKPVLVYSADASRRGEAPRIDSQARAEAKTARRPTPDDVALILHSSGTTGRPKLVSRTHRNIVANCHAVIGARVATSADRCLSLARAVSSQGCNTLMFTIFSGASLVRITNVEPGLLPRWIEEYGPTYISTTPAVLRLLAGQSQELRAALRHSPVTRIHTSAGPLSPGEAARMESAFGVPILSGYGMSEASGIAGEHYPPGPRIPGSVGPPWCELTIRDEHGCPLGAHDIGEIVIRGPHVFPGYVDDPAANAEAFLPDGWFRTGDFGYLDDAGYLHLTGRRGEIINRGGEKIVPREVDDVLRSHPAVAEAACFAVAHAQLGEDIVAAVVPTQGMAVSPRELRSWMLDRLAPSKVPRRVWFVGQLPRTPTGKVQRGVLSRLWSEAQR